jgi:hypothetical protein
MVQAELENVTIYYSNSPTAVTISEFAAHPELASVLVRWETTSEVDLLGFNLYRSESLEGERTLLNAALIPSGSFGGLNGGSYEFADMAAGPGATYYYWLEVVEVGRTSMIDPVSVNTPHVVYMPVVVR